MNDAATRRFPIRRDGLSKENTDGVRGILTVLVLLHHLYEYAGFMAGHPAGLLLQVMGYLCVGVFLFQSGYGLMASVTCKGQEYVRAMPRRRILPLWVYYLFLVVLYTGLNVLRTEIMGLPVRSSPPLIDEAGNIQWGLLVQSVSFGRTIVANGWYMQVILLFYIAFWLVCTLLRTDRGRLIGMGVFTALYIVLCVTAGILLLDDQPNTVYETVPCFLLGMLWYRFRPAMRATFDRTYKVLLAGVGLLLLFAGVMGIRMLVRRGGGERGVVDLGLKVLSAPLFAAAVACLLQLVPVSCAPTRWLGRLSLEIYTLQGVYFMLFDAPVIESRPLRWVVIPAATVITAWGIHWIFDSGKRRMGRMRRCNSQKSEC